MSNNFSEDLEVAQVNRGAIGEGAVGGLNTLSEQITNSLALDQHNEGNFVVSEPTGQALLEHAGVNSSIASDVDQNAEPTNFAFSDGSQPAQVNFNQSSAQKTTD